MIMVIQNILLSLIVGYGVNRLPHTTTALMAPPFIDDDVDDHLHFIIVVV